MSKTRRSPNPLPMPAFGTPADGIKCQGPCGLWYHRSHFWRKNQKKFVSRCADCIARTSPRHANKGNKGVEKPKAKSDRGYGRYDLAAVLRRGGRGGRER
jgi:hypothetical protein